MPKAILFLDANVLYSACVRDILLELAIANLCQCRWSEKVLAETRQALLRERPDISRRHTERLFVLMSKACPEALRQASRPLPASSMAYASPSDLHVVQAAYAAHAAIILTFNLRHFYSKALAELNLSVASPDAWLTELIAREPDRCLQAMESCRRRLQRPSLSRQAHLEAMRRAGLVRFSAKLRSANPPAPTSSPREGLG